MGGNDHTINSQNIEPITAESIKKGLTTKGLGAGLLWDINIWIALAVASGVIGNLAYDVIKAAILATRSKLIEGRKHLHNDSSENNENIDSGTSLSTIIDVIKKAQKLSVKEGRCLYVLPNFDAEDYSYFVWWIKYNDKVHKFKIKEWSSLTEDELEKLISEMYVYAGKRLREIRLKDSGLDNQE